MDVRTHLVDLAEKINKLQPLHLGDKVIHKSTGLCGTVESVGTYSGVEGQVISVALFDGRHVRGISRLEFALHTRPSADQAHTRDFAADAAGTQSTISVALEGTISDASILDELC